MWYTLETLVPINNPDDPALRQLLQRIMGEGVSVEAITSENHALRLSFNEETNNLTISSIDSLLDELGKQFAAAGAVVCWESSNDEGLYCIGPDAPMKKRPLVDHVLNQVKRLLIERLELGEADADRISRATRTLLAGKARTMMIGADPQEQQLGMCYVIDAYPEEAQDLIAELQNQPDTSKIVHPDFGDFEQAAFLTARDLLELVAALDESPNIYRQHPNSG